MHLERYEIYQPSSDALLFEFISEGRNGAITKAVLFTLTSRQDFYNLGFGDVNPETGEIDDYSITDNGDTQLVLATVAAIAVAFMEANPEAMIFATGSTPARTRLYRMGITNNLPQMEDAFYIFGYRDGSWESFQKLTAYEAFYVKRKR